MDYKINFSYAFQPVADIRNREPYSYEALIRGLNNEPPTTIFAQISGVSFSDFDQEAREFAIKLAAKLGLTCNLNLNFLPSSLSTSNYLDKTINTLEKCQLDPKKLIIEMAESELIHQQAELLARIKQHQNKGIKIAIDDFGTGYPDLNLLERFQPNFIKLDIQLIRKIDTYVPRQTKVKAIVEACIARNIHIIAEGVETVSEYQWLNNQGIYLFQGYLFSKPGFECLPAITYPEV